MPCFGPWQDFAHAGAPAKFAPLAKLGAACALPYPFCPFWTIIARLRSPHLAESNCAFRVAGTPRILAIDLAVTIIIQPIATVLVLRQFGSWYHFAHTRPPPPCRCAQTGLHTA